MHNFSVCGVGSSPCLRYGSLRVSNQSILYFLDQVFPSPTPMGFLCIFKNIFVGQYFRVYLENETSHKTGTAVSNLSLLPNNGGCIGCTYKLLATNISRSRVRSFHPSIIEHACLSGHCASSPFGIMASGGSKKANQNSICFSRSPSVISVAKKARNGFLGI